MAKVHGMVDTELDNSSPFYIETHAMAWRKWDRQTLAWNRRKSGDGRTETSLSLLLFVSCEVEFLPWSLDPLFLRLVACVFVCSLLCHSIRSVMFSAILCFLITVALVIYFIYLLTLFLYRELLLLIIILTFVINLSEVHVTISIAILTLHNTWFLL